MLQRSRPMDWHRLHCVWLSVLALYVICGDGLAQPDDVQPRVKGSVDRGVRYLKAHAQGGKWGQDAKQAPGFAALTGWTLLETGVPGADPAVRSAADFVR